MDAPSAKKAQLILKTNSVDLILCDWEMPEMTGEEFLRWIREQEHYADLPFIMVTSRGERDFIVKAVQAGVSDYLGKPFKPESLVAKVTKVLAKVGKDVKAVGVPATDSLSILTGGATPVAPARPQVVQPLNDSASVLLGGAPSDKAANPKPKAKTQSKPQSNPKESSSSKARGQALLTFAGFSSQCVIKDISLQLLSGAIKREQTVPTILETVVISIVQTDGTDIARLNGYVHSIQAAENRINVGVLKLVIRFMDDDPEKLKQLSRYIASL